MNKLIRTAERYYSQEKLGNHKCYIKRTWSIIKEVIGKKKSAKIQTKFKQSDGEITADKKEISHNFDAFFINIGPTLAKSFEKYKGSPTNYLTNPQINSLFVSPVLLTEICNIVCSLKDSARADDEIRMGPLRSVLPYIDGPLTYLCNLSLSQGIFPDILKIANVIPLYKKDDPMLFINYRPVSLLCSLSKILEKIMYNRVTSYLDYNKILFKYQFGFRKSHSTYLALTILMDKISKSLANGDYVIALTLSQWSSSGNPVAIQCAWNLDPSVHWNATGEMPVCFQWFSSGFPVAFQWSSNVFQLCKLTLDRHWDTTGYKHRPVWFQWHPSVLVAPVVFQCVPIMQINTGSPLEHHWVLASTSVVPVASQCTCGSSGLPVRSVQWYPSVQTESGLEVIGSGHFPACDP